MIGQRVVESPVGYLTIGQDEKGVCSLEFGVQTARMDETPVLMQAQRELQEYFAGRRREFSVPLSIRGTVFQQKVWLALQKIPYGETITYGELACRVGNPKACRAVGMANHVNRLPVFVPCHRVVGAGGKLTGYAGGLEIKMKLLEIEGKHVKV